MNKIKEWIAHGFKCKILKAPIGCINGYVAIPKDHPDWGKDYDEIGVNVHGGLTYGQQGRDSDLYWYGFDTAHSGDAWGDRDYGHRWTAEEVEKETEKLALQFAHRLGTEENFVWEVNVRFSVQVEGHSVEEAIQNAAKYLQGEIDDWNADAEIISEVRSSGEKTQ